jgi:hypothetical protein
MSVIICQYCSKDFKEKKYMVLHQKRTKYCLKIQEDIKYDEQKEKDRKIQEDIDSKKCSGCQNIFSTVFTLKRHTVICLDFQLDLQKKKFYEIFEEQNIKFEKEQEKYMENCEDKIEFYKNIIDDQKETIEKLQKIIENNGDRLERIVTNTTNKMGDVVTNTTNKMGEVATTVASKSGNKIVNIQNNFNKVEAFDQKWIEDKAKLLTYDDIGSYQNLSTFIARNIMSNVYMSDKSRKKVTYKDENGKIQKSKDLYELIVRTLTVLMPKIKDCLEDFKGIYNTLDDYTRVSSMGQFIAKLERISHTKALTVQERDMLNNLIRNITKYIQDEQQFSENPEENLIEYSNTGIQIENIENNENEENIEEENEEEDNISKDTFTTKFQNLREEGDSCKEGDITYEFKYNYYRNTKRVYEKYGDYYVDDDENVIHPIEFEVRKRFLIKQFLKDIEPKKICDLETNLIPDNLESNLLLTKLG